MGLKAEMDRLAELSERALRHRALLSLLDGVEGITTAFIWCEPNLAPMEVTGEDPRGLALRIARRLGAAKAEKVFNDGDGTFHFIVKSSTLNVKIPAGKPTRCATVKVEEEVIVPEHREIRTKYKLADPACLEQSDAGPTT